ncbi:MAG: gliding motility-associated protein GldE [Muribaculaceae bacterium]|nr:gliding motility-associated protein GldE [Muribaculaceae bacterium]
MPAYAVNFSGGQFAALIVALLCLILSGFVSGSEIAFFSLGTQDLEDLEDSNPERGSAIEAILEKPQKLLATILIANNLVNVTIVVLCNFALGPVFEGMSEVLSFILQSVILTFLILLFGEILPKLYSNSNRVRWAVAAYPGIAFLMKLFSPFSRMLVSSTRIVNRVVTRKPQNITADELSQALEITQGASEDDKEMLEGILRFGDTTAGEIMTPRTSITGLEVHDSFAKVMKTVVDSGFSRLPAYENTQDDIVGVLYARDLLPYVDKPADENFDWRTLLRKPYFVPESRQIDDLLEDFRKLKIHMAIVVDEFGGTQGIVTLEDVLEEIVGDIDDEYDEPEQTYRKLPNDTYVFEGRTLLTDFFRVTDLNPDEYEAVTEDAETLAGMLLAIKGDFPANKEPLVYGRCRFLVLDVTDHRINEVRVKVMPDIQEA